MQSIISEEQAPPRKWTFFVNEHNKLERIPTLSAMRFIGKPLKLERIEQLFRIQDVPCGGGVGTLRSN